MGHIEKELRLYDVKILESILKDTFSNTCNRILTLLSEEYPNAMKRKRSSSDIQSIGDKVYISEITRNSPVNVLCVNCGRSVLVTNSGIRKTKDAVAISRGSRYQHFNKETNCVHGNNGIQNLAVAVTCNETKAHEQFDVRLKPLWKYNTGKCVDASPLVVSNDVHGGTVYIGSHSHRFSAIDLTSGKCRWEIILGDRVESSACLSLCQQYIVVGMHW